MFIGHFAMGFFAKRVAPRLSLGALFVGGQLLDLIWPVLVLANIEAVSVEPGRTAVTPLRFDSYIDGRGRWVLWTLVAFLALAYAGNVFGPPPEPETPAAAIAAPALAMWLLVAWGAWADRHRAAERPGTTATAAHA